MACSLNREPGLVPASLRRSQNSFAQVVTLSGALGTKVSVTHATFAAACFYRPTVMSRF
jgi:hypothetical protein